MSKNEILLELSRLPAPDRREILDRLWEIEEGDVLHANEPSPEEKTLLDEALAAYERNPGAGRPWRDVLAEIRGRKAS
jgi:hypothetical protein